MIMKQKSGEKKLNFGVAGWRLSDNCLFFTFFLLCFVKVMFEPSNIMVYALARNEVAPGVIATNLVGCFLSP